MSNVAQVPAKPAAFQVKNWGLWAALAVLGNRSRR